MITIMWYNERVTASSLVHPNRNWLKLALAEDLRYFATLGIRRQVSRKCSATYLCNNLAVFICARNVVVVLLKAGHAVNALTGAGAALHEAALCGKTSVVRALLARGADPRIRDRAGDTVLDALGRFPPHVTHDIVGLINSTYPNSVVDSILRTGTCALLLERFFSKTSSNWRSLTILTFIIVLYKKNSFKD